MLLCALRGQPAQDWLQAVPEPVPGCWAARPLRKDVWAAVTTAPSAEDAKAASGTVDVLQALALARRIAGDAQDFNAAIAAAKRSVRDDAPLVGGLVGAMFGLQHGVDALPADAIGRLASHQHLDVAVERCVARLTVTDGATT
jgi:ADP-ribosylglycohydrolase